MPGIHVRSLGKLDWVERGNEPILTIPGAYWLCHKKHIYKFTFKWHKTLRNTEGFAYPKELTKVIRRIIKSQPRQGQQFGTRHLLVTYNHSAWMRQDKMFAMLKFRDRTDATAFPHAFVLTVKTLNAPATEVSRPTENENRCANTDPEVAENVRLRDSRAEDEKSTSTRDLETKDKIDEIPLSEQLSNVARESETERRKSPNRTTKRPASTDDADSPPPIKKLNRPGQSISEKTRPPDSSSTKIVATDSADLPYQYLIEKEIEDSKSVPEKDCLTGGESDSGRGPSHGCNQSSLPGRSLPRSPRGAQTDTTRSADITDLVMEGLMFTIRQDQDSVTVVEQKTKLEMDEVLENSEKAETKEGEKCLLNSSLLRLENLITKIEMSEAKIKSKDNIPRSPFDNDRSFLYSSSGSFTNSHNPSCKYENFPPRSRSLGQSPISEMPKFPLVQINLNNIRNVFSDKLNCDPKETRASVIEDEAMDIDQDIPEYRDDNEESMSGRSEDEEEEDEVGLELKYEEKEEEEDVSEDSEEKNIVPKKSCQDQPVNAIETKSRSMYDLATTPIKDCIEIIKSNTPRIISNELVTDDQIPPELHRALRYKRTKRLFFDKDVPTNNSENVFTIPTDKDTKTESPILAEQATSIDAKRAIETVDITEEFERQLSSEKRRKQPARRKSLRHVEESSSNANETAEEPEIRIEMWKFMQDITRGAKVVVRRLDLSNIPNRVATESSISKYNVNQQYVTES